jgi:hypothetical protein
MLLFETPLFFYECNVSSCMEQFRDFSSNQIHPRRTSGTETAGSVVFWRSHGSSIPVTAFIRFHPEPVKTGSRIRSPDYCVEFLAFSGGFSPGIHGVMHKEPSSWAATYTKSQQNNTWGMNGFSICFRFRSQNQCEADVTKFRYRKSGCITAWGFER